MPLRVAVAAEGALAPRHLRHGALLAPLAADQVERKVPLAALRQLPRLCLQLLRQVAQELADVQAAAERAKGI